MKKILIAFFLGLFVSQIDYLFADDDVRIKEVIFVSKNGQALTKISTSYLLKHISTKEGVVFDEGKINRDIKRLFEKGLFTSVNRKIEDVPGGKKIIFEIDVAPKINYIVFQNLDRITRKKIVSEVREAGLDNFPNDRHDYYGRHLTYGHKVEIKEAILQALRKNDFVDATVEMKTVPNDQGVALIVYVQEKLPVRVNSFNISPERNFTQGFVASRRRLKTSEKFWIFGGKYNYSNLQDDIGEVRNFYYENGYLDVTIDAVIKRHKIKTYLGLGSEEQEVDIDLQVEEGDLYSVGEILVAGNELFTAEEIKTAFEISTGDIFNSSKLWKGQDNLEELYGKIGYIVQRYSLSSVLTILSVVTVPDYRTKTVAINISVKEGREITIKDFIIRGNERTRDEVMRREMLNILPNKPFDWTARKEALRRLKNLNYFEDFSGIDMRLDDNVDSTERDMILEVKEKSTGNFNFGVGVSSDGDVFGNFTLGQRNFDITDISGFPMNAFDFFQNRQYVGKGQRFNLQASPGSRVSNYSLGIYEPWLFGHPVGLDVSTSFQQTEFTSYSEDRLAYSASLSRRVYLADQEQITYGMGYRHVELALIDVDDDAPSLVLESDPDIVIRGPSVFVKYDTRDNFKLTTSGQLHEFKYEVLGGPFGGTDLLKTTQKSSFYFTVGRDRQERKQILSFRSRIDWQKPYNNTEAVPIFERHFLGGGSTLRGYKRFAIGPQPNGTAIGGAVRHFGSLEYSVPIISENVRGVTFLDYGTLHQEPTGHIFTGYRFGAGVGIRFTVPGLGFPVALDLAHPVGPKSHFERSRNFHFQFAAQSSF